VLLDDAKNGPILKKKAAPLLAGLLSSRVEKWRFFLLFVQSIQATLPPIFIPVREQSKFFMEYFRLVKKTRKKVPDQQARDFCFNGFLIITS
jgi:hypothetical protein